MTWGLQNTQEEANQQLDYALAQGINFIDTAELYPVPPSAEGFGRTEQYIGHWIAKNKSKRGDYSLATKVSGNGIPWVRDGADVTGADVKKSIDASLARLQTDYIDLYQIHWSNRPHPHFAKHWPGQVDSTAIDVEHEQAGILDLLSAMDDAIKAGKIRYCGISDETPWGINEYLRLADQHGLPRIASIQNEFNLLHLKDSPYVTETCVLNDVAFMPWSPLAGGALTGKYANGAKPEGARWTRSQRNGIFRDTAQSHQAIAAYQAVADKHDLSLTQMCLAWVYQFPAVTTTIIGATSMDNLKENIGAYELRLNDDVLKDIDGVIKRYPMPF